MLTAVVVHTREETLGECLESVNAARFYGIPFESTKNIEGAGSIRCRTAINDEGWQEYSMRCH
jgi:hypothetical protein